MLTDSPPVLFAELRRKSLRKRAALCVFLSSSYPSATLVCCLLRIPSERKSRKLRRRACLAWKATRPARASETRLDIFFVVEIVCMGSGVRRHRCRHHLPTGPRTWRMRKSRYTHSIVHKENEPSRKIRAYTLIPSSHCMSVIYTSSRKRALS